MILPPLPWQGEVQSSSHHKADAETFFPLPTWKELCSNRYVGQGLECRHQPKGLLVLLSIAISRSPWGSSNRNL